MTVAVDTPAAAGAARDWLAALLGAEAAERGAAVVTVPDAGFEALVDALVGGAASSGRVASETGAASGSGPVPALGRVIRIAGVESDAVLPFSVLGRFVSTSTRELDEVPSDQLEAIDLACGLTVGEAPKPALVGLAVRSLVRALADGGSLLVVLDDAQWIDGDSLDAFASVARHPIDGVVLCFAVRGTRVPAALGPLPRHALGAAAGADGPAGAAQTPETLDATVAALPRATRAWLLIAALEPARDPVVIDEAASAVSLPADAAAPAVLAGLLDPSFDQLFRTAAARSAVIAAAPPVDRRAAHELLWQVASARSDRDRRAWHRAASATGPDELVARELEAAAERATARGARHAAAAALRAAVELSEPGPRREERLVRLTAAERDIRPPVL